MGQRISNASRGTLAAGINDTATALTLGAGQGDRFPQADVNLGALPSADDWFKATITNDSGEYEIVYVRTRAGGVDILSNLLRGQEGTTARAWDAGAVVGLRMTALDWENAIQFAADREWDNIPPQAITASGGNKTATSDARGRRINTDGNTVTVPAGVFSDGQVFTVYNNDATARALIQGAGVTLRWENSAVGNRTMAPYALVALHCVGPNEFRVVGAGVT